MPSKTRLSLGSLLFTWDALKYDDNVRKHGITFEEAATTWFDPFAIERYDDAHSGDEDRWLRVAASLRGALLVVWSTDRLTRGQVVIRIIGARLANRRERALYEEGTAEED